MKYVCHKNVYPNSAFDIATFKIFLFNSLESFHCGSGSTFEKN